MQLSEAPETLAGHVKEEVLIENGPVTTTSAPCRSKLSPFTMNALLAHCSAHSCVLCLLLSTFVFDRIEVSSLGIRLCQVQIFHVSGSGIFFCTIMVACQIMPFSKSTTVDLQGNCMKMS